MSADHVLTTRGTQTCGNLRSRPPSYRRFSSRIPAHCGILRHPAEPRCGWFDPSRAHSSAWLNHAVSPDLTKPADRTMTIAEPLRPLPGVELASPARGTEA